MMRLNPSGEELVANARNLERQGQTAAAIAAYQHLLESWPGLPDCWFNLAVLQRQTQQYIPALASYQEALERGVSQPEEVHLNRGVIYSDGLNQYDAAERELKKALALNPTYIPALINYANLHEDLGRRDLAADVYERVLALSPEAPQVLARYAGLKNFSNIDDPMIGRLRGALTQPEITDADRANIEFALGRALDACGAYDAAFETYRAANRHSRDSAAPGFRDYSLSRAENDVQQLIRAYPTVPPDGRAAPLSFPAPIFICGMFRSGSTLTEQLLAGHPRITAGGELEFLPRAVESTLAPYPESIASAAPEKLLALADEYRAMLGTRFPEAAYVTDKRPDNFRRIGLIKSLFPNAKIIHTTRASLDNCLAIYFLHLDHGMNYAFDLMDIGHHYRQYRKLMSHWKALYGADIIDVTYDTLVEDPEPPMKQILASLELEWHEDCLAVPPTGRAIKTASVWQVREPLYRRSSGRARHYERWLGELRKYLEHPL
jgi:tetratricopeptide (TPR) repeat protein